MIGIPYAPYVQIGGAWFAVCQICGNHILLVELKDFESFSGIEYENHYYASHAPQEAEISDDGDLTLIP